MKTSIKGEKKYSSINPLRGKQTVQKPLDSRMIGTEGGSGGCYLYSFFKPSSCCFAATVKSSAYRGAYRGWYGIKTISDARRFSFQRPSFRRVDIKSPSAIFINKLDCKATEIF